MESDERIEKTLTRTYSTFATYWPLLRVLPWDERARILKEAIEIYKKLPATFRKKSSISLMIALDKQGYPYSVRWLAKIAGLRPRLILRAMRLLKIPSRTISEYEHGLRMALTYLIKLPPEDIDAIIDEWRYLISYYKPAKPTASPKVLAVAYLYIAGSVIEPEKTKRKFLTITKLSNAFLWSEVRLRDMVKEIVAQRLLPQEYLDLWRE